MSSPASGARRPPGPCATGICNFVFKNTHIIKCGLSDSHQARPSLLSLASRSDRPALAPQLWSGSGHAALNFWSLLPSAKLL